MPERPFFFENRGYRLFGFLHSPPVPPARSEGFVFCYPDFEEKLWVHRVYVSLARELAARGYHVLRYDCMGHGDSDGDFAESTVSSRQSDLACAVATLRKEMNSDAVGLLGLRFGATLAAVHAEGDPAISRLVLWDPVTDGAAYMQEVLLSNLATQSAVHQKILFTREDLVSRMRAGSTVNIEGYELNGTFYEEASGLRLGEERRFSKPCLIAQLGRGNQRPKKNLAALQALYPKAELALCAEEPFWKEIKTFYPRADNLFGATISWLQTHDR